MWSVRLDARDAAVVFGFLESVMPGLFFLHLPQPHFNRAGAVANFDLRLAPAMLDSGNFDLSIAAVDFDTFVGVAAAPKSKRVMAPLPLRQRLREWRVCPLRGLQGHGE